MPVQLIEYIVVALDGARLVPGYGPSILQGNVALMESTHATLAQRYAAELNSNDPTHVPTMDEQTVMAGEPSFAVGLDFLAVIQTGSARSNRQQHLSRCPHHHDQSLKPREAIQRAGRQSWRGINAFGRVVRPRWSRLPCGRGCR